jgi:hypothetical protein
MQDKTQASAFEQCLGLAERRLVKVREALEETRSHLLRGDTESAHEAAFDAADLSERLTLAVRGMPAYTGHPQARVMTEDALLRVFPVEIGFTAEGWFSMRIPILLPKKGKGSASCICDPLYPAMIRFWRGKPSVRYPDNVIVFRHVYDGNRPERQCRDHDNIELNRVVDIVALYVMLDDSAMRCRHYYCSASGSRERTEVYVLPRTEFSDWLAQEDRMPDEGVILYDNKPRT